MLLIKREKKKKIVLFTAENVFSFPKDFAGYVFAFSPAAIYCASGETPATAPPSEHFISLLTHPQTPFDFPSFLYTLREKKNIFDLDRKRGGF